MGRRTASTSAASLVLAALVCVPGASSSVAVAPVVGDEPARILVVGDSTTQGSAGDWTWRYRLWQHLVATADQPFDLVGPHDDLWDRATRTYGHQTYTDPGFDRDHASRWGLSLTFPERPIGDYVSDYQVDVVVELLGIDDLVFLGHSPSRVRADLEQLVADARAANPAVHVVLGEVAQTWLSSGAVELNTLVHQVAAETDRPDSRVVVAEIAAGFRRRVHTHDDSHPSAAGELLIASAVADSMAEIGIGRPAIRPLPAVPEGPRAPVRLSGELRHGKVRLGWAAPPGADGYRVLYRHPGVSRRWRVAGETGRRRWVFRGLHGGERVQVAVLPRKGRFLAEVDMLSNVVRVRRLSAAAPIQQASAQKASRAGSA